MRFLTFSLDSEKLLCFRYYDGSTLDYLAQTNPLIIKHPYDKFKKIIKLKSKNKCKGIENDGFQDECDQLSHLKNSNSLEDFTTNQEINSGAKKKSSNGLVKSESVNMGGTKKKIRSSVPNSKSSNKDYYQLWKAYSPPSPTEDDVETDACDINLSSDAPPLPPRALHRPLERSHALNTSLTLPPVVHRQNKPKKIQKLEDTFGFELIDTDEEYKSYSTTSTTSSQSDADVVTCTPTHKLKASLLENSRKLIGSDNYITTVLSKNIDPISSPQINAHLTLESKDSQSSISTQSSSSGDVVDGNQESSSSQEIKPHKPLTRQMDHLQRTTSPNLDYDLPQTPTHHQAKLKKTESKEILRPHPKALARVAGITNNLPICPPTPTHHSRKTKTATTTDLRPPSLKSSSDSEEFPLSGQEVLPAPDVKQADIRPLDTLDGWAACNGAASSSEQLRTKDNPRISVIAMSELRNIDTRSPEQRSNDLTRHCISSCETNIDGEASGGVPLPLQRLSTTRLPSIPERSHRILTVAEIPGEHEEPLPPCKCFFPVMWRIHQKFKFKILANAPIIN